MLEVVELGECCTLTGLRWSVTLLLRCAEEGAGNSAVHATAVGMCRVGMLGLVVPGSTATRRTKGATTRLCCSARYLTALVM